jgi:hypothetical protein
MQTIPTEYKQAGHLMRLQKREKMAAMYQSHDGSYWEIHRIRIEQPRIIMGKPYPEREVLCGNEKFGTDGWACVTQERADGRFREALALFSQ